MINLALISGVSGAGKTFVLSIFEENGYYVIDNLPLALMKDFVGEIKTNPNKYSKVALAIPLFEAKTAYDLVKNDKEFETIFLGLDCSDQVLFERFRLTRRLHPLQTGGLTLEQCIENDAKNISKIRHEFTNYIDTSKLSTGQLRKHLYSTVFVDDQSKLSVTFVSFGYKRSIPHDIDIVLDARTLPNPYWVDELKEMTGLDKPVKDFIFSNEITKKFLEKTTGYLDYVLDKVKDSSRKSYIVGIACTGGQHRSVAIAEYLKEHYSKIYKTSVSHRELDI